MVKTTVRDIGIDVAKPSGTCADAKCPFHGTLPIRGKLFQGEVVSSLATKTATVRWEFASYVRKFERYARKNTKVVAYNPACIGAKRGDVVRIAECRPLSKTKRFVVIEKMGDKK
ncbi:MAG: 30S ribosomal protein S17 [Candidatus Aenigmarchaeota archaeon]|nr:30S ribosomal protein S17 [Candidatus Aenigmarchaeota archaeon]